MPILAKSGRMISWIIYGERPILVFLSNKYKTNTVSLIALKKIKKKSCELLLANPVIGRKIWSLTKLSIMTFHNLPKLKSAL